MKALYPPLSYTLFIAIGIIALSVIMVMINSFTDGVQKSYALSQLDYTSEVIRNEILRLYSTSADGKFQLYIPKDIVGKQYLIELNQKNLKLSLSVGGKIISVERLINTSATLSGKSYAPASIEMGKVNGDVFIRLV